ncbi:MAG TPA: hypothetical protein VK363_08170 [Pyrinomonadaceae bacterium]|nr:hypothetical protein [Pyrinomonadaceae bacterium]
MSSLPPRKKTTFAPFALNSFATAACARVREIESRYGERDEEKRDVSAPGLPC